ncbi:hypothetical protein JX265_001363 [Neoarthrinium moseri]|uniref:Mating-type switching protein swi10 n=1 Tax=Neoarthrinium moseri TaxID=1658444 RepID=A0A9P9WXW4_9PEZI|nr:hypothetical protein JX265_001363 [Neoarthrinium moseri]
MASPQPTPMAEGKKLRRKLQKIGNPQRYSLPVTSSSAKSFESIGFIKSIFAHRRVESDRVIPPTIPSPDLDDSKWTDYLRTSGYVPNLASPPLPQSSQDTLTPPAHIIPELAHLSIGNARSTGSSETLSSDGPSTPSTSSVASAVRRYAKTPVTRIGQLEGVSVWEPVEAQDILSAEALAESYRALLNSRSSFMESRYSTPMQSFDEEPPRSIPTPYGIPGEFPVEFPVERTMHLPFNPKTEMESPTPSDGTLVGFEEDAIYFKPVSFSPEQSTSPCPIVLEENRTRVKSATPAPTDNHSMQIIFDLLTKELSSAASGNRIRPSAETSALQIWIMIEAYEKLREQVDEMALEASHANSMQAMLSTWLRALYAVHDRMTGNDGQHSESDYGDLEPEGLD